MNPDGSGKTQLTFGNVVDESGDYSPDGKKIAFTRYGLRGGGISDIMIMNADGTNIQQITSTGLCRITPRWSNDGTKLAFYYGGAGSNINEIHIMSADGTNEITVVSCAYPYLLAYWSPDDTKLVYPQSDGIWLASTSQPYETTHLYTTTIPAAEPVFNPDGKYILFSIGEIGTPQNPIYRDLCLIDTKGNFVAQLTNDGMTDYPFDWSPDGQYVAFGSRWSGTTNIWRARIVITAQLTVVSAYDSPNPGGTASYTAGTSITASVTSPVAGPPGTQYVCTGWSGTGDVPATGTGATVTFAITQDSSITWNWKTQYYLTVKTAPSGIGTIFGEGWYDQGQPVPLTAPINLGGYRLITMPFSWDADGTGQGVANPINVVMNAPHTATAHYSNPSIGGEWGPTMLQVLNPVNALSLAPWIILTLIAAASAIAAYRRLLKKHW